MNIGKEEGGSIPKVERGSWNSRAEVIQKKGRFGNKEVVDVKRDAFPSTFRVFHSTQPTFRTINP